MMRMFTVMICCMLATVAAFAVSDARAEGVKKLSLDSLPGKYEGRIQIHSGRQPELSYKTEVVSVDKKANTVSLVNSCQDCETKVVKKNDCPVKEAKETITFVCKGKFGDEEYIFNGERLKATGVGAKNPYTITVKKVAE